MQVVIPMSGCGQRFVDAGYDVPKPFIEVDGGPMIEHVLALAPGEREEDHIFICNEAHRAYFGILERLVPSGTILTYNGRDRGKGPVSALTAAFSQIRDEDEVFVSYCDYGTRYDYENFLLDARRSGAHGSIACYRGFHPHMLGKDHYAYARESEGWLTEIREKCPFSSDKMSEYASNGTYYFRSGCILKQYCESFLRKGITTNGEFYVSGVYNEIVQAGFGVRIFEIQNMLQWGTPYDLRCYQRWSKYFRSTGNDRNPPKSEEFVMIVPLAGRGSRFAGYSLPKPLLPVPNRWSVGSKPMVLAAIADLPRASNYIYVCLAEHVSKYQIDRILDGSGSTIIAIPETTGGQACTCEIALGSIGPETPIMITACDNTCTYDATALSKLLADTSVDVIVFGSINEPACINNPNMYAWLETDSAGTVKHVSCKQFVEGQHSLDGSYVIEGTMFFRKALYFLEGLNENYKSDRRTNGEFYVDDVINRNIEAGLSVKVFPLDSYICWGTPDDYQTYLYWHDYFDSLPKKSMN